MNQHQNNECANQWIHQDPHPYDVDNELPWTDKHQQAGWCAGQRMCQHRHWHDSNTNDKHAAANPFANANTIRYNNEQPWKDEHQWEEHKGANQWMHQHQYQHNMLNNTHANAPSNTTTNGYEQMNTGEQEHKRAN